jgi:methionyl-tRNA formyltransferase
VNQTYEMRVAPVRKFAQEHGLRVHEVDTFEKWEPPEYINMVVAVSFGLLVPGRVLESAKYGGLNVHPSLLPEYAPFSPSSG